MDVSTMDDVADARGAVHACARLRSDTVRLRTPHTTAAAAQVLHMRLGGVQFE